MMNKHVSKVIRILASGVFSMTAMAASYAETFPAHPMNMIVPYAAGGSSDFVARLLADKLGEQFGPLGR
jgi:tripartite-type tricarboxylate transporter receptor subunit TctC